MRTRTFGAQVRSEESGQVFSVHLVSLGHKKIPGWWKMKTRIFRKDQVDPVNYCAKRFFILQRII